jgi:hypothetical protein
MMRRWRLKSKAKELNTILTAETARLKASGRYSFDEQAHIYRMDGHVVPSVTKIIAPPLPEDLMYNSAFIRKTQMGTDTHGYCEAVILQEILDKKPTKKELVRIKGLVYEDIEGYCAGFDAFMEREGYTFVYAELRVHSHVQHFAGTLDILAYNSKGQLVIMDIKTTVKLQPYVGLQLAGYTYCFHEMFGKLTKERIKGREVLWLQDKGKYTIVPYKNKTDESVMICKLISHQWDIANGVKK